MTKRERYLKALRNEQVDELVWAPNFDYWLKTNTAEGTLPEKYYGMSRNDIVRKIGGYIWNRAGCLRAVLDSSVKSEFKREGGKHIREYHTPAGSIRQVSLRAEGDERSMFLSEHFVKDLESLRVMKFVAEATRYEPDFEPVSRALGETGDDGVVVSSGFLVPFIRFAKTDAGYQNGFLMWMDHRKEVDSLINVWFENYLEGLRVAAQSPADVIATGDNMDGVMVSPEIFREYAVPYYTEAKKILEPAGKIFEGHWCGRTQNLLPLVPGCGLDVVEAVVTRPMADVALKDALGMLRGEAVLQGGIPSVTVCPQGGSYADFEEYIRDTVLPLRRRRGFILGMGDNVPPNADFSRVEAVSGIIS